MSSLLLLMSSLLVRSSGYLGLCCFEFDDSIKSEYSSFNCFAEIFWQ